MLVVIPQKQCDKDTWDDNIPESEHGEGRALAAQDTGEQQFDGRIKGLCNGHLHSAGGRESAASWHCALRCSNAAWACTMTGVQKTQNMS